MVFPKNIALEYDLSCIIWKYGIFSGKYNIYSLDGKWKVTFLKKYMDIWYFLYKCINVTNIILPFCKKNQRQSSPEKIYLKVIDSLDRILERVSRILCTFKETFIYCFPVKKKKQKQETQYIGLKFDFFFNLLGWRYSTMKTLQLSVRFSPQKLYLEVCLSANYGNYFSIRRWVINPKI